MAPERSVDGASVTDARRTLPSVEAVRAAIAATHHDSTLPSAVAVDIARTVIDAARRAAELGADVRPDAVLADAIEQAQRWSERLLGPVHNATGVLLHTNLGRAPLAADTLDAVAAAGGAVNLEYDMDAGRRGSRHDHAGHLLALAVGAEAGIVVNNNAAAVLLVLAALARGREVVVSRGELVEIGGGFRVPEILAETGARLVEVGTTNRTRLADYEAVIGPDTAMTLKVHASNYRMIGFTESTPVRELARLDVPVVVDAGSGLIDATTPWLDTPPEWLGDEPGVRQAIADGAALVTFSGDKLLGGPQAGVVVGRRDFIARLARHPLARALRADKLTLAALQHVARTYLDGTAQTLAVWQQAASPLTTLQHRAEAIARQVDGAVVVATEAAAGGGSVPGRTIASCGVAVAVDDCAHALRQLRVEHRVVALTRDNTIVADLRSLDPSSDAVLVRALQDIVAHRPTR